MTKIKCDLTGCKYNSSCCSSPHANADTFCTKEEIYLAVDEEMQLFDCKNFEEDYDKAVECNRCQMLKYGGIKMNTFMNFE